MLNQVFYFLFVIFFSFCNEQTIQDNNLSPIVSRKLIEFKKEIKVEDTIENKHYAIFIIAYNKTMKFEGGYVNDHSDSGRETYKGISRKYNSKWHGWKTIDSCKRCNNFPKILYTIKPLELLVQELYKKNYWDKMRGDEMIDQEFANQIFDTCVNMGVSQGIKITQESLNIAQTGIMDDKTLKVLNGEQ